MALHGNLIHLKVGLRESARLAWGGDRLRREREGYYLAPALFTDTTNAMRINREEIFGPVATVIRARDYDEALVLANDTPLGLSSGIVTTSLKHASHFKRNSQAGMVMVNLPTAGVPRGPGSDFDFPTFPATARLRQLSGIQNLTP